jgi:hypothetical protein
MKNLKYILLTVFSLMIASSCSNFEELNTNPDSAATVPSDMLATQLLKDTYRFWNPNPTDWSTANLWCKHMARLDTNGNPYQYYGSYWPYGGFGNFKKLTDANAMAEFSKGLPTAPSYKGLALFLKAYWGLQMTLDMGDIPYSEAGMAAQGITQPKYDKQEDVFAAILKDFEAAEASFAAGTNFTGDIMYGGDVTKWRKLCNTMQLKVIQTIKKEKVTAAQKARFAAIVAANNLMTGSADDLKLTYLDNPNATHPFYDGETNRIYDAGSQLLVDNLKLLNDRRLFYFLEPAGALITAGKLQSDYDAYAGAPTEIASETLALGRSLNSYSLINIRYTLKRTGDPMLKTTYSEQCFIIAEAIEEGWVAGSSQTYYENGVKAQLAYYMNIPYPTNAAQPVVAHGTPITQAYIDGYFTGSAAYAATKADRLKQIWMQRWLIDFFQGSNNYYATFLRTGYPVFPLNPATSQNPEDKTKYPPRLKYDTGEQVTNPVNYKAAVDSQYGGFDGTQGIPWYIK